ncbi:hypothetical protein ACPV5L_02120 [Vibrio astriarenae]
MSNQTQSCWVSLKSAREYWQCLRYLQIRGIITNLNSGSKEQMHEYLNQVIETLDPNIWPMKKNFVELMLSELTFQTLTDLEIKWIRQNERCINWAWAYVAINPGYIPTIDGPKAINAHALTYSQLALNPAPTSKAERYTELIKFFDSQTMEIGSIRQIIQQMQNHWLTIFETAHPFEFLNLKKEDHCRWAWKYLDEYGDPNDPLTKPPISSFRPSNVKEKHVALLTAYDIWMAQPDTKKVFMMHLRNAWQQKKYRDGLKNKKQCNFVLEQSTKSKLDELAKRNNLRLNEMIELLIQKEYESIVPITRK